MIVIAYMIVIPGTIKRLKREELVTLYKERMAELKKLNDQNRKIQDILDPLGDVLEEVQVPFDCFGYASQDLASAIEKCLKKYDKRYVIVQKCLFVSVAVAGWNEFRMTGELNCWVEMAYFKIGPSYR